MRAVKSKYLREKARGMTLGKPERQLMGKQIQVTKGGKQYVFLQAVNDPQSTRGVYRALKKNQR